MSVSSIAALAGSEIQVADAIAAASRKSGVSFNYLLATARRESALKTDAKSTTSSASGLFQFVSQTWLSTLKSHGGEYGLGNYANAISRDAKGHCTVSDPALKGEILALRQDPTISAQMAAALAGDNAKSLESQLSRPPTEGELYAAHVLGAAGAARLISGAQYTPTIAADVAFPEAAAANRGLFYDPKTGQAVTLGALYARLTRDPAGAPSMIAGTSSVPTIDISMKYEARPPVSFSSDALAVLNAIQPRDPLVIVPDNDKDKDKEKARAARADRALAST